jgi:hypothetical protein
MSQQDRVSRLRHEDLKQTVGNLAKPPTTTGRMLVQVYDGGHIPTQPDHFYLAHPVYYSGDVCEGCPGTLSADTAVTIAVDVLGQAAVAGDYLDAHLIGGRWVAEKGMVQQPGDCRLIPCGNCQIPRTDLTVAWTNPIIGNGSATLVYSASNQWQSACTNQLIYQLLCTSNQVEFRVTYFISGSCPTGQSQFCSTLRPAPFQLQQTLLRCGADFELDATVTSLSCANLSANGYLSFKVTGPYADQPPPKCLVCFTILSCGPIPSTMVTVSGGPGPGGSGTTDSNGFVAIDIGEPGTYTVTSTASGYTTYTATLNLKCGNTYTITMGISGNLTVSWTSTNTVGLTSGSCTVPLSGVPAASVGCADTGKVFMALSPVTGQVIPYLRYFVAIGCIPDPTFGPTKARLGVSLFAVQYCDYPIPVPPGAGSPGCYPNQLIFDGVLACDFLGFSPTVCYVTGFGATSYSNNPIMATWNAAALATACPGTGLTSVTLSA